MKLSDIFNSICIDSSVENKNFILLKLYFTNWFLLPAVFSPSTVPLALLVSEHAQLKIFYANVTLLIIYGSLKFKHLGNK